MSKPILKPQYRWKDGHFQELPQTIENVSSMPIKGTYVAIWNGFNQKYEFGESDGLRINRVWDKDHLPDGFRSGLLLMGV